MMLALYVVLGVLGLLANLLTKGPASANRFSTAVLLESKNFGARFLTFITMLLFYSLIGLYFFSRIFLIVEVFLSLPHEDPAVYNTPDWSPYWPHIS